MLAKLMIFFLLNAFSTLSIGSERVKAGYDPAVDIISGKYEAGPYLIYDCVDQHWVCVLETYYSECLSLRETEIIAKTQDLSCAPMGVFPTKKSCFERQLYLTGQNSGTRFCLHPDFKQKEMDIGRTKK